MGTIQNKRASGRGAPPTIACQFMPIGGKETESEAKAVREVCKAFLFILVGLFLLGLIILFCNDMEYEVNFKER